MVLEHRNLLLRSAEPDVLARFSARLHPVELSKGVTLHNPGDTVDLVYFPESALVAGFSETAAGESVATSLIGVEGALGVFEACGSRTAHMRCLVQVTGRAWRMRAGAYRELYDASALLRTAVHKHIEFLLAESRQSVACNAIHPVEGRLSRYILEGLERSRASTTLPLTQEALAHALGVQRTTVAVCVSALQKQGVLRSSRGAIEVTDRSGLEKVSCLCRQALVDARRDIYRTHSESCDA
ncbi:MAG: transcriptional regulator, Crp/Fnr family [Hyphomicrobiales bacterium]|nr:transcriptional regulator, Crp/Fnr family [Hyphomicrobiales bacterium]